MRRIICVLGTVLFCTILSAQTDYYRGYHNGFRFGCQCYDNPPKNVSAYSGTYDKGYYDGKLDGSIYAQHKASNTNQQNGRNQYNTNEVYVPDFELIYRSLQYRQSAYSTNQQKIYGLLDIIYATLSQILDHDKEVEVINISGRLRLVNVNFTRSVNQMNNSNIDFSNSYSFNQAYNLFYGYYSELESIIQEINQERSKTIRLCSELKLVYGSYGKYPQAIKDGWHNVMVLNDRDLYAKRTVLVKDNKIVDYLVDECYPRVVEFSNLISNGRTMVKLKGGYVEVYFLAYILNPEPLHHFKPLQTGSVSFWTDDVNCEIEIIIGSIWIDKLTKYFSYGTPNCGQNGTLKIDIKPGTHYYSAHSSNKSWKGQFTVVSGQCVNIKLPK